ncbi:hypothetical protein Tco_1066810 [Tanacetum coccineum]|uniref:Uncharacterized protein n=1 Tax=Tanacetum coccineum TaxID=301880 RepID=A0ABQ5HBG3_9ASTR
MVFQAARRNGVKGLANANWIHITNSIHYSPSPSSSHRNQKLLGVWSTKRRTLRVVSLVWKLVGCSGGCVQQGRKIDEIINADTGNTLNRKIDDDVMLVEDSSIGNVFVKPKVTTSTIATTKGILLQEPSESTTTTTTIPLKDKSKVRLAREKDEANVALIEEWNDIQAKIDADYQMAKQIQAEEQEELSIEEKSKLFVQLLEARKKHFATKRAEEKRNMPPTRAQQRSIMCTYLKNMAGWKPKDLKNMFFANIQELFDKAMKRVNTFVDMDKNWLKGSEVKEHYGSKTRKKVFKYKVAVDAIPLATKPPSIVDWKILKEGKISYYQIIRADGSSKRNKVLVWKIFDLPCGSTLWDVLKLQYHLLLVEKRYPLTPATITEMLNKKLQADHWNEMCYQLLKVITKLAKESN